MINIKEKLLLMPLSIKDWQHKVFAEQQYLTDIENRKKDLENATYSKVHNEKVEGKAMFSNDKLRDIETDKRLRHDKDYISLLAEQHKVELKLHEAKISLEYVQNEFKAVVYLIRLLEVEK